MEILAKDLNGTLSAGAENFGAWQVYDGARITTASTTTRDPGAQYPRILPGRKSIDTLTLRRDYDPVRDAVIEERLEVLAGTHTLFTIGRVERDGAGNILRTKTRVGKLLELGPPTGDTNSDTDKTTLEAVFGIEG